MSQPASASTNVADATKANAAEIARILSCKPKDYFAVLGCDIATCAPEDIKQQYKRIVLLTHPDKCPLPKAADAFHVAEGAYNMLKDEKINPTLIPTVVDFASHPAGLPVRNG